MIRPTPRLPRALGRRAMLVAPALLYADPARALTPVAAELVTTEEATASARVGLPPVPRSLTLGPGPRIEVVQPAETGALRPPVAIRLRFVAGVGARVVPETFRALYGALLLDVTDRLRGHARIDAEGLVVDAVSMPSGQHRLLLRITDDQGRRGERDFRLRIE